MASKELRRFLHKKYKTKEATVGLNASPEVEQAAQRTIRRYELDREALPINEYDARIANYLYRFREFRQHLDETREPKSKERAIERAKHIIVGPYVTTYEEIPASYWKSYEATLRSHGMAADWASLPEDKKEEMKRTDTAPLLEDQYASLEEWFDYFISHDSDDIPDELKYWVFRSLTQLQEYEKTADTQHVTFSRRSRGSLKKFPDLNHEALRQVTDSVEEKYQGGHVEFEYDIEEADRKRFRDYLKTEKFADLYAWACELTNPIPEELLPNIRGEWRKYAKGSDSELAAQRLRGKGTGLCIAGRNAAKRYIANGDLWVYFSLDEQGQPVFPRAAIHVAGDHVAEVRGIAYKQNLDLYIEDVVSAKLAEFPDGHLYQKKTADMRQVTTIERKTKANQELTKAELAFLYEVDTKIQGFGYQPDPRIPELRKGRDQQADMLVIFDCTPDQIAHNQEEVMEKSETNVEIRAYIGPLYPGIFAQLDHLEHIYTQFPERRIRDCSNAVGGAGRQKQELQGKLDSQRTYTHFLAKDIMGKPQFTTSLEKRTIRAVRLTIADLGFPNGCTTAKLFGTKEHHFTDGAMTKFGLEFLPAEFGPNYRIDYTNQPEGEWLYMGMEPILGSEDSLDVFNLHRRNDELRLDASHAHPDKWWSPHYWFVFGLRKVNI